jgi:hypothetical protein
MTFLRHLDVHSLSTKDMEIIGEGTEVILDNKYRKDAGGSTYSDHKIPVDLLTL